MDRSSELEPSRTPSDTSAPGDGATLAEVVASFGRHGYVGQFAAGANATVECATCGSVVPALRLEVLRTHRFEGASDPSDMMRLYGVKCPACDAMGTLILAYGVNADEVDADVATSLLVPSDAVDVVDPTLQKQ